MPNRDVQQATAPRDQDQPPPLSEQEMQEQEAQALPDRENMSLINANIAVPINAAVAANVLSDGAIAYADAAQTGDITQGT
jgi:hypothetical protein